MPRVPLIPASLALVLPVLAGCSADQAPTHPRSGELLVAFTSERPPATVSVSDIYFWSLAQPGAPVMPPNVNTPQREWMPAYSGNGNWLAYVSSSFALQLALYNVSTGQFTLPAMTAPYLNPWNPSLSYDGHYVAFQVQIGDFTQLDVVLGDAFADTIIKTPRLHAFGAADFDPSLSGDGRLIAFATTRDGSYDIALYDVAGDSLLPLPGLNTPAAELAPSISRDGRLIAFESNRAGGQGGTDIYVYDRRTASLLPLPGANTQLSDTLPSISPDGRYVAFQTDATGGGDIRLYDINLRMLMPLDGLNDAYYLDASPTLAQIP